MPPQRWVAVFLDAQKWDPQRSSGPPPPAMQESQPNNPWQMARDEKLQWTRVQHLLRWSIPLPNPSLTRPEKRPQRYRMRPEEEAGRGGGS